MPTAGVGAWRIPPSYRYQMPVSADQWVIARTAYGVISIQKVLIKRGYLNSDPAKLTGGFGVLTKEATIHFQKDAALVPDGIVGPKTARRLYYPHIAWWQAQCGIPNNLLYGELGLESGFDPGAEGMVDRDDRGIAQYNRHWHPEVPDEKAFGDALWCIQKSAGDMQAAFLMLRIEAGSSGASPWDCAIAHHNNPVAALAWARDGKAPNDGIKHYVELVRANAGREL